MRLEATSRRGPPLGPLFGACTALALAAAAAWLKLGLPLPQCPLHRVTGLPCPTCGSTRLVEALLAGDVVRAAALNPLVFAGGLALAAWAIASSWRAVRGAPHVRVVTTPREALAIRIAVGVAIALNWAWVLAAT